MLHIGCHLSVANGYAAMGRTALSLQADTFQFFTRNPRGASAKEIDPADAEELNSILRENHCRSTLYNAEKLWLADKMGELEHLGLRWLRLNFTTENTREIEAVIQAYQTGSGSMPERATRGLYYRGVQ